LMRVGLAGSDVGADQAAARASLGGGDFDDATARAAAIERRLDGATRQGAVRLGLAGALLALTSALVLVRASRARAAR